MNIFVTGASGWKGSAVVPELIQASHTVTSLARSDTSAAILEATGAKVERGTIKDIDVLKRAADASDGVIHLAFNHELAFTGKFQEAADEDRLAVETFGDILADSNRPLVIASGILGLTPGHVTTEQDGHGDIAQSAHSGGGLETRGMTAEKTLGLASRGVRSSIVRLSPTVHGDGDHGFMATVVGIAQTTGVSNYIGHGTNRWPAVHRLDAARLFRLALENAPAGSTLHAVADEGVSLRDIAEVIGRKLGISVASIPFEDAAPHFTWLTNFLALDSPASSTMTQKLLNWHPEHLGLIADFE